MENCAYGSTVCAEASALAAFISNGGKPPIEATLYLYSPQAHFCWPCGNCRQIITEILLPQSRIVSFDQSGQTATKSVEQLMDQPFTFAGWEQETK